MVGSWIYSITIDVNFIIEEEPNFEHSDLESQDGNEDGENGWNF